MRLTAIYVPVPEGYLAFVEELPGANTRGETLDEARENLRAAVGRVLDSHRELAQQALSDDATRELIDLAAL
jgi:predicted RNase H-like HicB family nuclease